MEWIDDGVVVSVRRHGEAFLLVSLLTSERGRHAGLVRTGSKGAAPAILQAGNTVRAKWRGRFAENLGTLSCELIEAHAAQHLDDRAALACLSAACAIAETALPEREPHPRVFAAFTALLGALNANVNPGSAYVKWEMGVLAELGFGLDLRTCAVTGRASDLCYVSPRTGRAVSGSAAGDYRDRMLALPPFLLTEGGAGSAREVIDALALTGHFLERHVYGPVNRSLPKPRRRLVDILGF